MKDALEIAGNNLNIQNVRLKEWEVWSSADFDVESDSLDSYSRQGYRGLLTSEVRELESDDHCLFEYKFFYSVGLRFVKESDLEKDVEKIPRILEITAEFEANYLGPKLDEVQVDAFSENNVGFNVWPFWRELVQTSSARLGLTSNINVPFYQSEKV